MDPCCRTSPRTFSRAKRKRCVAEWFAMQADRRCCESKTCQQKRIHCRPVCTNSHFLSNRHTVVSSVVPLQRTDQLQASLVIWSHLSFICCFWHSHNQLFVSPAQLSSKIFFLGHSVDCSNECIDNKRNVIIWCKNYLHILFIIVEILYYLIHMTQEVTNTSA